MFGFFHLYFRHVPLLHFQHLTVVVCPYGLYLGLQCFDGFLVCGYLPMQGGVLPLQRLDLVAPEKRTDTLGDVGGCGRGCPFQPFGLYLFFRPFKLFPCRFFPFLQFHHFRFQLLRLSLYVTVILLRGNVPRLRTVHAPL